jgi:hypothetical protein
VQHFLYHFVAYWSGAVCALSNGSAVVECDEGRSARLYGARFGGLYCDVTDAAFTIREFLLLLMVLSRYRNGIKLRIAKSEVLFIDAL